LPPKIYKFSRRVGITGLRGSGKTVFLTSLINHLMDHDPLLFPVDGHGRAEMTRFKLKEVPSDRERFNYEGHRDAIVNNGQWPRKTRDSSLFRCSFERTDWALKKAELEFFDFPGERIADAVMTETKDFAKWSEYILAHLSNLSDYRGHAAEFLKLQEEEGLREEDLTHAYRLTLARLILAYKPLISPSTFLLGTNGDMPTASGPQEIAQTRYSGLDTARQFTPLSDLAMIKNPALYETFAKRYKEYRKQVVLPVFDYLKKCHSLVVLVDVPTILSAGTSMFDDNMKILQDLFTALNPGSSLLERLVKGFLAPLPLKWYPGGITRVCFAASKADMVHPADRDKLLALLRQMTRKLGQYHESLKIDYRTVSSVVSTRPVSGEGKLMAGFPMRDRQGNRLPPDGEMQKFPVSGLPDEWPAEWKTGDYSFVRVYPHMPKRRNCPPEQFGMDRVLDFVMKKRFAE
jgi:predicted YcjX-like family ATPase